MLWLLLPTAKGCAPRKINPSPSIEPTVSSLRPCPLMSIWPFPKSARLAVPPLDCAFKTSAPPRPPPVPLFTVMVALPAVALSKKVITAPAAPCAVPPLIMKFAVAAVVLSLKLIRPPASLLVAAPLAVKRPCAAVAVWVKPISLPTVPGAPLQTATALSALLLVPKGTNLPVIAVNTALPAVALSPKLASPKLLTVIVASAAVEVLKKNSSAGKIPTLLTTKLALPAEADPLKENSPPFATKDIRSPAVPLVKNIPVCPPPLRDWTTPGAIHDTRTCNIQIYDPVSRIEGDRKRRGAFAEHDVANFHGMWC